MRRLAAALFALATLTAGVAHAADISKDQRDKGMKEAPAAVQKAGVTCTVSDAYFLGASNGKDGKQDVYEVACQQGMGYVLLSSPTAVRAIDCLASSTQPTIACKLPANADPKQGLKPDLTAAGLTCTPANARYIGANATVSVYEVACQEGSGYILQKPLAAGGALTAVPCIQQETSGNMACTLTTKAQDQAYLAGLASKSGHSCQISGDRYIGSDKTGLSYYEVGCGAQPGFIIATNKTGGLDRVVPCNQAKALGGCTLTNAAQLAAADTASYTQQAKAGGFNCDVSKYRAIGQDPEHNDVVELACSNRPDGVVAVFPAQGSTAKAHFVDCLRAGQYGENGTCELTQPTTEYSKLSSALAAKGRSSCKVSGARYLGHSPSGTDFIETACADGKPGYVVEVTESDQLANTPLSCGQAKSAGLQCKLPTNVRG
jgi:hypothetical protein